MENLRNHEKEDRPWGNFERFTENEPTTVKILTINPGEAFSLQTHAKRDEFWRIMSGSGVVHINEEDHPAAAGDSFYIPRGTVHRATGGETTLSILEIAFGEFEETDITRIEDKYGRS